MPRTPGDRILDAAATCIARVGVAKTTLDDVAREAGCARATVYRCFPGKQQLITALVGREVTRTTDAVVRAAVDAPTLADAAAAAMITGTRLLAQHASLTFVAAHEPEIIMPFLAFERESAVLQAGAQLVAPGFERHLGDAAQAERLAEWLVRMTLSFLFCPSEHFDLFDEQQVRSLIENFILPGISRMERARSHGGTQ
ncbi:MAG TPA: TetR/AcrR family transcriptional regulator [Acidimicrobiia bacterium]|nr:TetR/AcrR family transcriptional regulator [Acidimicrobiia bacterium]